MSEKVWLGGIYFKDEGGYEIVLKSLNHYKNRLKTLNDSPELKDSAAMFASVLNQQAQKTVPKINEIIEKIQNNLENMQNVNNLQEDIPFFEKALSCYESGDMEQGRKDLEIIKTALEKIKEFSE
jgi:uncharacterized phage infection (PIP) family protein YhgE